MTTTDLRPDTRYTVTGNTFAHRETLKAMGGTWDKTTSTWTIWTGTGATWMRERAELRRMLSDGVDISAL